MAIFFHLQMGTQSDAEKAKADHPDYDEKIVGFPKRYILALMIFLGFCVLYALRVNLNVAIGAMCNNHTIYVNGFYVKKVCNHTITVRCRVCDSGVSKTS